MISDEILLSGDVFFQSALQETIHYIYHIVYFPKNKTSWLNWVCSEAMPSVVYSTI